MMANSSQGHLCSPESGPRAGYDGHKRLRGGKVRMAEDSLSHLRDVHVTPVDERERAHVRTLCSKFRTPL